MNVQFLQKKGISSPAEEFSAFQEIHSNMELVYDILVLLVNLQASYSGARYVLGEPE